MGYALDVRKALNTIAGSAVRYANRGVCLIALHAGLLPAVQPYIELRPASPMCGC